MSKPNIEDTFNSISEDFDRTRQYVWPETKEFVETLEKKGTVLDLGCGNGKDTVLLLQNGFSTISVDISQNQCEITARNIQEAGFEAKDWKVVKADMRDLPFDDNAFDGVLFMASLHHLETEDEREKALLEMKRVLRVGAFGLISVWAFDQPRFKEDLKRQCSGLSSENDGDNFGDLLVAWNRSDGTKVKRFYHMFTKEEFAELMRSMEFDNFEVFSSRGNHFCKFKH